MMLVEMLASLPYEKLREIHDAILHAGISNEFRGDYRRVFKRLRDESSGRAKKVYSALAKADRNDMQRMADSMISIIKREQHEAEH